MSAKVSHKLSAFRRRVVRKGLTLIEAAMVLVILALVIGGVMLYYSQASSGRQTSEAAGQIAAVQQAVRAMYAGQADYTGLNNTVIASSLPNKMLFNGPNSGELRHAFNSAVVVGQAATPNQFTISFAGIPVEACMKLATQDLGRGVTILDIGGTPGAQPRTPADAKLQCGNAGSQNMTWTIF